MISEVTDRIHRRRAHAVAVTLRDPNKAKRRRADGKPALQASVLPDFQIVIGGALIAHEQNDQESSVENARVFAEFRDVLPHC